MTGYITKRPQELMQREIDTLTERLKAGRCGDMEEYKFITGQIRAFERSIGINDECDRLEEEGD